MSKHRLLTLPLHPYCRKEWVNAEISPDDLFAIVEYSDCRLEEHPTEISALAVGFMTPGLFA